MSSDIERILSAANSAPSGENCQPWRFVVRGAAIEVHLLPERDQSFYGWGQRASYLACGAALENLVIATSHEGYRADVSYVPNSNDFWHVATVTLVKDSSTRVDPLSSAIAKRVTNRKKFSKDPLSPREREALMRAVVEAGYGSLVLAESREDITALAQVGSTNERVMLGNRALHDFFFSHVNWTKEEDDEKKIGFYIRTLELPAPAQAMFKAMRSWSAMKVFKALGFPKVIGSQNAATYASSSAIGGILIESTKPLDFIKTGRAVERLWLAATALGLSLQPMTGVLFFKLKIDGGEGEVFAPTERVLILEQYERAQELLKAEGRTVAFMFRIGKASPPSAQAARFPLSQAVTVAP